jgi:hypothetical protein
MPRFDEIELEPAVFDPPQAGRDRTRSRRSPPSPPPRAAHRPVALRALALALSPLLPPAPRWEAFVGLGGFVLVISYYYFVGAWLLWGKTIGGAIFDIKVIPADAGAMALKNASLRWAGVCLSLLTVGIGFTLAALPFRVSLPDMISRTRCVTAH